MSRNLPSTLILVVAILAVSTPAYAYLDPGTGSLILQGAVAAIASAAYASKLYWYKIKAFFSKDESEYTEPETASPEENQSDSD